MKSSEIVKRLAVSLGSICLSCLALEGVAWIITYQGRDLRDYETARRQNAAYWRSEFNKDKKGLKKTPDNELHTSLYYADQSELRITTDQPSAFKHTIHMFGGSTMYGLCAPNQWTIASCLQRLVSTNGWKVMNYGALGDASKQQYEKLIKVILKSGDIVIFYGGANDASVGVRRMTSDNPTLVHRPNWIERMQDRLFRKYEESSNFVALFLKPKIEEPEMTVAEFDRKLAISMAKQGEEYRAILEKSAQHAQKNHVQFINFLQPTVFASKKMSRYEKRLFVINHQAEYYLKVGVTRGFPMLDKIGGSVTNRNYRYYNINDVLDDRKPGQDFYWDLCHVGMEANEKIAVRMFQEIGSEIISGNR